METLARLNVVYPNSHLIAGYARRRRYSNDEPLQVSTPPSKWPGKLSQLSFFNNPKPDSTRLGWVINNVNAVSGVANLRALLARDKDEDTPKLNILLCEAFVATYMSLMVYALATCDSHFLYRFAGQKFGNATWATLFGGGVKKLLRVAQPSITSQVRTIEIMRFI